VADFASDPFAPLPRGLAVASTRPAADKDDWQAILPAPRPLLEVLRHRRHGVPSRVWRYRDAAGALLFAVARFDVDGWKEVLPYSCGADGWRWKAVPAPRPLYGLDRLAARPDAPVLLVEGEKTADAAASLFPTYVAMTWPGGSKAAGKVDWAPLAGRSVTLWPDNDKAGRDAAEAIRPLLKDAGAVTLVSVPTDWPEGWDLADAPPAGVSLSDLAAMLTSAAPQDAGAPVDRAAELTRLARLSAVDYLTARAAAAQALGMGVVALDRAVRAEKSRLRTEAEEAHRRRPPPAPGEVSWPYGFFMGQDGLFADTGGDAAPIWLAAPFEVLGEARDHAGEGWGRWLRWQDRDGRSHTWLMPDRLLMAKPGELEAELVDRGLRIETDSDARAHLRRALAGVQTGHRARVVPRAGWHPQPQGGDAFLLQDGRVLGGAAEALILRQPAENAAEMAAAAGTLEEWQRHVAALAAGNPLAMFCIAAALAGPLLHPLGESSGGFHLFGRSKAGKTLALKLACSVWGLPTKRGNLRDWRSTANALEATAEEANDGLLALDEIHQAPAADVTHAIYMIGNEAGKGRMRRDSTAARRRTWRTLILSTGEPDTKAMVEKASQRLPAGAEVRLPNVPVDSAECWPALHGRPTFDSLAADLHAGLERQHGTAAPAFLAHLAAAREAESLDFQQAAHDLRARFLASLPENADTQVRDVARRFALVALAGELATEWGVLPWRRNGATQACMALFSAWRERRGEDGESAEVAAAIQQVRLFLAMHGRSRFVPLFRTEAGIWEEAVDVGRPVLHQAGWRRPTSDGRTVYLIAPEVWRADVCQGLDAAFVARAMAAGGFLAPGEGRNLAKRERIPGRGLTRVFVVQPDLLGDAE
jgi:uncharacterized protein (DUF927 family)